MNRDEDLFEDMSQMINDLQKFSESGEGVTRLPFTEQAMKAADYLQKKMFEIGLDVVLDPSGAVRGTLKGNKRERIIIASHYDTVINGGAYDGCLGIVSALALVKCLKQMNIIPEYTIEIIGTNDEEGVRFHTGYFTIKSMLGQIDTAYLKNHKDKDGISIYDAMKSCGMNPEIISHCNRDSESIKHFFEIHIEQGPILYNERKSIGIVDSIVGIRRYEIEVYGQADHAGTTPMDMRKDAVMEACRIITCMKEKCEKKKETVLTVGFVEVHPNAVNIIPEKVIFTLDMRSTKNINLVRLEEYLDKLCLDSKLKVCYRNTLLQNPVFMDKKVAQQMEQEAQKKKYSYMHLYSGAGHDALEAARVWPTSMIFIPSINGRSHCSEEKSDIMEAVKAVNILESIILN